MANKILLFLSPIQSPIRSDSCLIKIGPKKNTFDYVEAENTIKIEAYQTNEAPVKWILQELWHKNQQLDEIIMLVTNNVKSEKKIYPTENCVAVTAIEYFKSAIKGYCENCYKIPLQKNPIFTTIDFPQNEDLSEMMVVAAKVADELKAEDRIFIDYSGGYRSVSMFLIMISRLLSYKGIKTEKVVSANISGDLKKIEDMTPMLDMFDIINAANEFIRFGSSSTFLEIYKKKGCEEADTLTDEMNRFSKKLQICSSEGISENLEKIRDFAQKVREVESNNTNITMLKQLLPVIEEKLGVTKDSIDILDTIQWLVENDMIQQAVTVYNEKIPGYLINQKHLYRVDEDGKAWEYPEKYNDNYVGKKRKHEDTGYHFIFNDFLGMSDDEKIKLIGNKENLEKRLEKKYHSNLDLERIQQILKDLRYIKLVRNRYNHAMGDGKSTYYNTGIIDLSKPIDGYYSTEFSADTIKAAIIRAIEYLRQSREKKTNGGV